MSAHCITHHKPIVHMYSSCVDCERSIGAALEQVKSRLSQAEQERVDLNKSIAQLVREREEMRDRWTAEFDVRNKQEAQLAAARDALDACDHSDDECGLRDYKCVRCVTFEALSAAPLAPPVDGDRKMDNLLKAARDAKKFLEPFLDEPGRTVFWNLVEAIKNVEALAHPSEGGKEALDQRVREGTERAIREFPDATVTGKEAELIGARGAILEELKERGWTETDLALRMGGDVPMNLLCVQMYLAVNDKNLLLDKEMATRMGIAFGVSPEFLLNMDKNTPPKKPRGEAEGADRG